jgi:hypothetical protein
VFAAAPRLSSTKQKTLCLVFECVRVWLATCLAGARLRDDADGYAGGDQARRWALTR